MSTHPKYVKTPKGIEEVERKAHGLALKPRQVLIMIDGKRDLHALQGIFPPPMVPGILDELLAGGFIRELEVAAAPAPSPLENLAAQKEAMSAALYEVFGPDADNFTIKIDAAKSTAELTVLAAKYEETVASMGGRKKAVNFANELRAAGIEFASAAHVSVAPASVAPSAQPGAPAKVDLKRLKESMTDALFDAFGPATDTFTGKVDAAQSPAELEALGRKYADVIAGSRGGKKAAAFIDWLLAAGIKVPGADAAPAVTADSAVAPPAPSSVQRPESDSERLDMARNFMVNTTKTFIGIAGSSLIIQIESAKSLRDLRALYYDWREAMQLSSSAKQRLPDLEKRLAALLS